MFWNNNNIFLLINILLWLFTFTFYQKGRKQLGSGSFLLLLYLSMALIGMHLFNNPLSQWMFKDLELFPFIYLYAMIMLMTLPILKLNEQNIVTIQEPSNRALNIICIIIILAALSQIVTIVTDFSTGLSRMLSDNTAGAELYQNMLSNYDQAGDKTIKNLAAIISNLFSNISILMLFYYLTKEQKNKYIVVGLLLSVLLLPLSSIAIGLRGGAVNILLTTFMSYILLRNFLSVKIRKKIKQIGIITAFLISIPVMLITVSRFGENDNESTLFSMEWYYGQGFLNFNNYGLDAGGIRNGDRTAALFKQIIWSDTPRNYLERREKYSFMAIDESVFSTFVGDFTLDYGPVISFLIFVFLSIFLIVKTKVLNQVILFHQLILIYFVICICIQGAMGLFPFSDVGGNLTLLTFLLVYFWFKFDYYTQKK